LTLGNLRRVSSFIEELCEQKSQRAGNLPLKRYAPTQDYKVEGTAESEYALNSALDEARATLVSAEAAGIGGLTVRLLHEHVFISETVLRVIKKTASAPLATNADSCI